MINYFEDYKLIAGCDEAGRGCLAGPVFAAAVILPIDCKINDINDSKQLSEKKRYEIRDIILEKAIATGVAFVDNNQIDEINILNASILAMHMALDKLIKTPEFILVDGNKFKNYKNIKHKCVVKGDSIYENIAAASILAKTYRDDFMLRIDKEFPMYNWKQNKGYPTKQHIDAIFMHGKTKYHRQTFSVKKQTKLF
ncbi:MAG: ribonuclease HII [Bacteroidales bacterium]|jgi:ribonuclease HII